MNRENQKTILLIILIVGVVCHVARLYSLKFYFLGEFTVTGRCMVSALALYQVLSNAKKTASPPHNHSPARFNQLLLVSLIGGLLPTFIWNHSFQWSALGVGLFIWAQTQLWGIRFKHLHPVLLSMLATLIYPLESIWAPLCDRYIQFSSTVLAAKLVNWTEFPVEVGDIGGPLLIGGNIEVHVTSLCAGFNTLLSLFTLALILSLYFLKDPKTQLLLATLTPVISYTINIIRIAISTHAANQWLGLGNAWDVAHDYIGYSAFIINYMIVFRIVYLLRVAEDHQRNPPAPVL